MGSRCLNKAVIIGNVGEKPRLSSTNGGVPVCTFNVATNRSWTPKGEAERKEETQWHYIVAFNKLAEICKKILNRGTKVFISGRVHYRKFKNTDGKTINKTEIVASDLIALSYRKDNKNE